MERPCTCHIKCGDNMLILNLIVTMGDGCLQLATAEAIDQRVIAGYYAEPTMHNCSKRRLLEFIDGNRTYAPSCLELLDN